MPKFKVLELSYIDNALRQEGEIIDFNGEPGKNLEPLDKPAQKAASSVLTGQAGDLVTKIRLHAATRGVSPDEVNQSDVQAVLDESRPAVPSEEVMTAVLNALGLGSASV